MQACPRAPGWAEVRLCRNLALGTPRSGPGQEVAEAVEGFDLTKPLGVHLVLFFHGQIIDLTEKFYSGQKLGPTRIPETQQTTLHIEARPKTKYSLFFRFYLKPVGTSFRR